jgi:cytochrome P450
MLAAEGNVHKRHRRVATPAFSIQNMRALVPLVFSKGNALSAKWQSLIDASGAQDITLDVCRWVSRATFDVIASAGQFRHFMFILDDFICVARL